MAEVTGFVDAFFTAAPPAFLRFFATALIAFFWPPMQMVHNDASIKLST